MRSAVRYSPHPNPWSSTDSRQVIARTLHQQSLVFRSKPVTVPPRTTRLRRAPPKHPPIPSESAVENERTLLNQISKTSVRCHELRLKPCLRNMYHASGSTAADAMHLKGRLFRISQSAHEQRYESLKSMTEQLRAVRHQSTIE